MAGKTTKAHRKTGKARGGRKALTKKQQEVVGDIVERKLEVSKETKYVNDGLNSYLTLTESSPDVDHVNSRLYTKIPIVILEGDDYKSRDGDKVMLKSLQIRFRIKPKEKTQSITLSQQVLSTDFFRNLTLAGHIIRVDKTAGLTAGQVDQCLRKSQENWMDTRQSSGRAARKAFTVVHKFSIPLNSRYVTGLDNMGQGIPPAMWMQKVPKIKHQLVNVNVNKKMLFNSTSGNEPLRYDYYLFMTWAGYRQDAFEYVDFPEYINYWTAVTFQDI